MQKPTIPFPTLLLHLQATKLWLGFAKQCPSGAGAEQNRMPEAARQLAGAAAEAHTALLNDGNFPNTPIRSAMDGGAAP
jgi:hypothetical protein